MSNNDKHEIERACLYEFILKFAVAKKANGVEIGQMVGAAEEFLFEGSVSDSHFKPEVPVVTSIHVWDACRMWDGPNGTADERLKK